MTHVIRSSRITCLPARVQISVAPGTRLYQYGSRRTLFVNGVLSEVRVVMFDAERSRRAKVLVDDDARVRAGRRFGSSLAHTAERLAGLETASHTSPTR
jgi:hypothetical protein